MSKSYKPTYFDSVEEYFSKVDVYSKIVRNNYMFHGEIFAALANFIQKIYRDKPFSLLDLGCGNAFFMAHTLQNTKIQSYTACDLSPEIIEEAKKNMACVNCNKNFVTGDLSKDFLSSNNRKKYDLIWSSYALHHLSLNDKEKFFKKCYKFLNPGSYFILVDFVNDFSSRDKCMKNYKELVEKNWTALTNQDKEYLYDHVLNFDFPESILKYNQIALSVGFKKLDKPFQKGPWAYMVFETV